MATNAHISANTHGQPWYKAGCTWLAAILHAHYQESKERNYWLVMEVNIEKKNKQTNDDKNPYNFNAVHTGTYR